MSKQKNRSLSVDFNVPLSYHNNINDDDPFINSPNWQLLPYLWLIFSDTSHAPALWLICPGIFIFISLNV